MVHHFKLSYPAFQSAESMTGLEWLCLFIDPIVFCSRFRRILRLSAYQFVICVLVTCGFSSLCGVDVEPASLFDWKFVDMGLCCLQARTIHKCYLTELLYMQISHDPTANSQKWHKKTGKVWSGIHKSTDIRENCLTEPRNPEISMWQLSQSGIITIMYPDLCKKMVFRLVARARQKIRPDHGICHRKAHDQLWNGKREGLGNRDRADRDMIRGNDTWYLFCSRKQTQCHCRMSSNFSIFSFAQSSLWCWDFQLCCTYATYET